MSYDQQEAGYLFFYLIFGEYQAVNKIILLQAETSSSHQTLSTWCQYTEDAKLLADLGYLDRCINGDLLKLQEKREQFFSYL